MTVTSISLFSSTLSRVRIMKFLTMKMYTFSVLFLCLMFTCSSQHPVKKNSSLYSFYVEILNCDGKLVSVSAIPSYNRRCLLLSPEMRSNVGKVGESEGHRLALSGSRRPELALGLLACLLAWLVSSYIQGYSK